jgi:hypothetical protein
MFPLRFSRVRQIGEVQLLQRPCNIAALIFCCKNWLGMRHRPQLIVNVSQNSSQPSFHGLRDQGFDHQNSQRHDKRSSSAQDRPSDSEKSYLLRDS